MSGRTQKRIAIGVVLGLVASFAIMTPAAYAATVTAVTASPSSSTAGASATYTVTFDTSASGGLASGIGTITLTGPIGTQFPLVNGDYTLNSQPIVVPPTDTAPNNVTITTPIPLSPSTLVTITAGVGTTAINTTTAGMDTVSVNTSVDASPVASSPTFAIIAAAASQVVATGGGNQNAALKATFIDPFSATVEDAFGNPVLVANRTVTFTSQASGASGTFANSTTSDLANTGVDGVATTTAFTANTTAGSYTVAITSVGLASTVLTETNNPPTQLVTTSGSGQIAAVGSPFSTTLSTTIEDSHGNPVPIAGTTVTFTAPASGASGVFANTTNTTTTITNSSGIATATVFTTNSTAGGYSVSAASTGLTSAGFPETNSAAGASQVIATSGAGQSVTVGGSFGTSFQATIEDSHGNPVLIPGTPVTFTAPVGGASGTFANNMTSMTATTNSSGVATASAFTGNKIAGPYTVTATSTGYTSAGFTETNNAGAASQVVVTGGNGQTSSVGAAFAGPLVVTIEDSFGNPVLVSGTAVTFAVQGSGAGGTFAPGSVVTSGNGVAASTSFTANAVAGTESIVAFSVGLAPATVTETNSFAKGYDLVASDGGIFTFGGAQFFSSEGGKTLNKPVVGMATTPDGGGYWLVASDGGIFSFGNAQFHGSEGGTVLSQPVVGMAATPDGGGYWLVASDGGIVSFGDAQFYGSMGGKPLTKPMVGMAADPATGGYWTVSSDGGIFAFNAAFAGSMGGKPLASPVVGMTSS